MKQSIQSDCSVCVSQENETTRLLESGEAGVTKRSKRSWLYYLFGSLLFLLVITLIGLGMKWYYKTTVAVNFGNGTHSSNAKGFIDNGDAELSMDRNDDDDTVPPAPEAPPAGSTQIQKGSVLPVSIIAKLVLNDFSNLLPFNQLFDSDIGNHDNILAQSRKVDAITSDDCDYLINLFENNGDAYAYDSGKGLKYLHINDIPKDDDCSSDHLRSILDKIMQFVSSNAMMNNYSVVDDEIDILKYSSNGNYSRLHSDKRNIDGSDIIGNENKDYILILFLNSEYEDFIGGELEFMSHKSLNKITPVKGNIVLFGSDLDYAHRVNPVISGNRYVLRMFFEKNANCDSNQCIA